MSSKNKGDYEAIPDVEEGDVTVEENSKSKLTPEERYPNASSKEEASLLASIDDIIDNIIPTVKPPLLPVDKVSISDLNGFIALLKVPFFTFVGLVVGAIIVVALDSPIAKALYPYVAAVASFVASLPALRKSFEDASENLVGTIETKIKGLFDTVDEFAKTGVSLVQDVSDKMDAMFQSIKPTLDLAGKMEKQLKRIDPSIDIPDTKDVEKILESCSAEKITSIFTAMSKALNFVDKLPKPLHNKKLFAKYIIHPALGFFLCMQLYNVFVSQTKSDTDTDQVLDDNLASSDTSYEDETQEQWALIQVAFAGLFASVVQITATFISSQKAIIYKQVNKFVLTFSDDMQSKVDDMVKPPLTSVVIDNMMLLKEQVLDLGKKVTDVKKPLEKIPKSPF